MAHITVLDESVDLDAPMMVEGLPGVGLVGKIASDHLVEEFGMTHYANVHCDGVPPVAVYGEDEADLQPPVRLYADGERDLLVLQSDVPIRPQAASEFADCMTGWFDDDEVTPVYVSGLPTEKTDAPPALYGVASGNGNSLLEGVGVDSPVERGIVSGPTGALLSHAVERGNTAVGLIAESDPQFPDPEAARAVITDGIEPLAGIDVPTENLVERAEEIREAKERLAQRMQQADEESTQAQPLRMYQ